MPARLGARLERALRVDPLDRGDGRGPVDVAPLERKCLLWPHPCTDQEQEKLGLELTQAGERLASLQGELQQAKEVDREAYAEAIAAGKPEPDRKAEQLAVRIEAEQRRVDACVTGVENANAKLDKLRADNRSAWRKDALGKIAQAHSAYEESIRLLSERREALGDAVALHGWVADGIGISPITDALSGRTTTGRDGREPVSFSRVENELNDDAVAIAAYLRELDVQSAWSLMKRAEACLARTPHANRRSGTLSITATGAGADRMLYLCPRCASRGSKRGLCPDCQRADDRRRNNKRRVSGRTTAAWQRLRLAAFHRDCYACQRCGEGGTRYTLTVHLDPALKGNHWTASLDDLTTLCRSCHGSVDAPRAHANY